MKKIAAILMIILATVIVPSLIQALPPEEGGCWVIGIGTLGCGDAGHQDSFGGNAMTMKDKAIRGSWTHISAFWGVIFNGDVHYIVCKKFPSLSGPGVPKAYPNYVNFGGTGKFNGEDGYFFDVKAFDHGEPGIYRDRYSIDIYDEDKVLVYHADGEITRDCHECLDDVKVTSDLAWVLDLGCISGGNIQIQPPVGGHPY